MKHTLDHSCINFIIGKCDGDYITTETSINGSGFYGVCTFKKMWAHTKICGGPGWMCPNHIDIKSCFAAPINLTEEEYKKLIVEHAFRLIAKKVKGK